MVLQAVAYQAHADEEQALRTLGKALALAEPGGIIRTFVDEGPPMAHLLHEIPSRAEALNLEIALNYVRQLLRAIPDIEPERTDPLKPQASVAGLIEPLSKRELEVLRLLKTELSGPEIAQELTIALSTFQSHTKSIYSKLNVNSRRAAVIRAEDLNLI